MRPPMPKPTAEECEQLRSLMIGAGCGVIDEDRFGNGLSAIADRRA